MKVLLIQPRSSDVRHQLVPPLGLLAIGTYLKYKGYEVTIVDRSINLNSINKLLDKYEPDFVGVSAITGTMLLDAVNLSKVVKNRGIPVIWGGVHPSLLPEQTLQSNIIDYIVIGEAEESLFQLLQAIENKSSVYDVEGIAFMDHGSVIINESRSFIDLSKIPITDWSLVNVQDYFQGLGECKKLIRIYTSKGCPGKCTFCYNQAFHKQKWRGRAPEQIADEVQLLVEKYGADGISFIDELWSSDISRMHEICNLFIKRKLDFKWYFNARVDQYTIEDLELMYKAGCRWILFGIESASPRILRQIKKGINLERVTKMFEMCRQIGISTIASFMLGFPDETEEDLRTTAEFAIKLNATYYDFTRYMCYPGTELYNYTIENHLFNPPETLQEWAEISSWDRISVNLTKVSDLDLSIINDFFVWVNLKRMMKPDQFRTLLGYFYKLKSTKDIGGFLKAIKDLLASYYEVLRITINLIFHPVILKKYGLTLIRLKGKDQ